MKKILFDNIFRNSIIIFTAIIITLFSFSFLKSQEADDINKSKNGFLPSIGILVDTSAFTPNKPDYSGVTHRIISIDIFRAGNYVFSSKFDEGNFYRGMKDKWYKPFRIQYYTEFLNLRREFNSFELSIFTDHICNNIIDEYSMTGPMEKYQIGWYRYGIKIETQGNRTGYKNHRINFNDDGKLSFLGNIDYKFAAGKTLTSDYGYYKAIIDGSVRIDLFKWNRFITYSELSCFSIWDWKGKADFGVEIGSRIHFDSMDITPFAKFTYAHNVDYYNGMTAQFKSVGLRFETLFESPFNNSIAEEGDKKNINNDSQSSAYPQLHFIAGYGKYINNDTVNFNHNFKIDIDLFRFKSFSPYITTSLAHNSMPKENPWPRYLRYQAESGIKYYFAEDKYDLGIFCSYNSRNEANFYKGYEERFFSFGAKFANSEMSSFYGDYSSDISENFSFVNKFGWIIQAEKISINTNYKYDWIGSAGFRWKIMRIGFATIYVFPSIKTFIDKDASGLKNKTDNEYSIESGFGIRKAADFCIYYKYGKMINIDRINGIDEKYHLIGFKIKI
ncbi:MAG TPA: hypothetical protein PK624_07895 [Spirochaetota bacterium]|nr:hypothetical protein [Spirochaetota bacterium]HOR44702.1 hypothetical protein [Spirochaetota bacterium]HPK56501.1 hypothetical protein [Spirochaetota bacterium]HPK56513.1 hypothetical protein [Spirochaetota bacterium]